jgi:hypothetical protein
MSFDNIIDPVTLQSYSIYSNEAKSLLKSMIYQYQRGGTNGTTDTTKETDQNESPKSASKLEVVTDEIPSPKSASKLEVVTDEIPLPKSASNAMDKVIPGNTEIVDCDNVTFCETRDLVCKTDYKDIKGIRKCGVLLNSAWNDGLTIPISAVYYDVTNPKLDALDDLVTSIEHVDSRFNDQTATYVTGGAYGKIYRHRGDKEAIKIIALTSKGLVGKPKTYKLLELNTYYSQHGNIIGEPGKNNNIVNVIDTNNGKWKLVEQISKFILKNDKIIKFKMNNNEYVFKSNSSVIDDFIYNEDTHVNEVDIGTMWKHDLYSYLLEPLFLNKLSQIEVGEGSNRHTVAPKISDVYLYIYSSDSYYIAYSMEFGKQSLADYIENINKKIKTADDNGNKYTLTSEETTIVNKLQTQIYELLDVQYDTGYMNLDIKLPNLLFNQDMNVQIIDAGATDFTHKVEDELTNLSVLPELSPEIKKEVILFAQQLIIYGYYRNAYTFFHSEYTDKCIPLGIDKILKMTAGGQELVKLLPQYLNKIGNKYSMNYGFMLDYYGYSEDDRLNNIQKPKFIEHIVNEVIDIYNTNIHPNP